MLHTDARWIQNPNEPDEGAVEFERVFSLEKIPAAASLSLCGLGFFEALLNGKPVTDKLLTPPFTAYNKRAYYQTFDVTSLLVPGENTLHITLGSGWFRQTARDAWAFEHAEWRAPLMLIASLCDEDGHALVVSGRDWFTRKSRLVFSQLREGETFDASIPEFPWQNAEPARSPGGILEEYTGPDVEIDEILDPVARIPFPDGVTYDFGVNLAGGCEITVKGAPGSRVTLSYGERLYEDGSMDNHRLDSLVFSDRFQTDSYILSGNGEENWSNRFTYNGFRYISVTGDAELVSIRARGYHTRLPEAGGFECDNPLINFLEQASLRSTRTNYHHMPTDCPHREKNGWTGDAHLSSEQALFHFDMVPAYRKWLKDLRDAQRPNGAVPCICPTSVWGYGWGSGVTWDCVVVELPWQIYWATGDETILTENYDMMRRYTRFMTDTADADGISRIGLGDWCAPAIAKPFPTEALLTAVSIDVYEKMVKIAHLVAPEDEAGYQALADKTRGAFHAAFDGKVEDTQTYLAMLLWYGLTDDPVETGKRLCKEVREAGGHVVAGIFGIKYIFRMLTACGAFDLAYAAANKTDYPSFGKMLSNGSGTLWEDWTADSSLNHHMFSTLTAWFIQDIAGIRVTEAGYRAVRVAPHIPEDMKFFKAWHNTPMGRLEVELADSVLTVSAPSGIDLSVEYTGDTRIIRG